MINKDGSVMSDEKKAMFRMDYEVLRSECDESQFKATADVVRKILDPWLRLHFGERCEEYAYNCECCARYKLADELLSLQRHTYLTLEKEIEDLEHELQWRKEMLERMRSNSNG